MGDQLSAPPVDHPTGVFFKLPYSDRRLITFVDADVIQQLESAYQEKVKAEREAAERTTTQTVVGTATDVGVFLVKAMITPLLLADLYKLIKSGTKTVINLLSETASKGVDIRPVPKDWWSKFNLPLGHPSWTAPLYHSTTGVSSG